MRSNQWSVILSNQFRWKGDLLKRGNRTNDDRPLLFTDYSSTDYFTKMVEDGG